MEIKLPKKIDKGWGCELVFVNNQLYCGKILMINKGCEGSMHFHMNKTETWLLHSGTLRISTINPTTSQNETAMMYAGETLHIPVGMVHKMVAVEASVIFEVSTKHEDSDTYRISPGNSQNK